MPITNLHEVGYIDTPKDDEFVYVNVNSLSASTFIIDARVWVENDNYTGWTKKGLSFRSTEEVDEFIALLHEAQRLFKAEQAKVAKAAPAGPRKPKGPRAATAAAQPAKKVASKKAAPKKKAGASRG